jgi:Pyridoxamine 5'-phosphate oxidase
MGGVAFCREQAKLRLTQYEEAAEGAMMKKAKPSAPRASRPYAPGYGLPETNKGLLPWSWAEKRLERSHNYWITTVKPNPVPHTMVVWGLWQDGRFLFSTGSKSRKARNLAENKNCIVSTELANEAVIVEGIAEIADVAARRKFLPVYERKYKFDMKGMAEDILAMKEPVFAVRPHVVFGLWEKYFATKTTRWKFE